MKIKLVLSYLGTNYSGSQVQKNKLTIQGTIENVLHEIFNKKVSLIASGRTDAGVSALNQIAHFEIEGYSQDVSKLYKRMNVMLPEDIRILKSEVVPDDFHSRFNAKKKTYCYNFYVSSAEIPMIDSFAFHVGSNLNIENMEKACEYLVGEKDFGAFCASNTDVVSKVRTIYYAKIIKNPIIDGLYTFEICGNGFLYNMVRIIVGTLLQVGYGVLSIEEFEKIIKLKDRTKAGRTAKSKGLFLKSVQYN